MARTKQTCRSVNTFRANIEMSRVPRSSTLTYEGLFSENFFEISNTTKSSILSINYSNCIVNNPINTDPESKEIWQGLTIQSKFDGLGFRNKPIDLVIILDISSSMCSSLGTSDKSCIYLAKKAILELSQKLNADDRIGLCTFNEYAESIIELNNMKNIKNFDGKVEKISACGSTNLLRGLNEGLRNYERWEN